MNWLRNGLIGAILVVIFLLFTRWNEFQERQIAEQVSRPAAELSATPSAEQTPLSTGGDIPDAASVVSSGADEDLPNVDTNNQVSTSANTATTSSRDLITVKTDNLSVSIDPLGGDIVDVSLPKYLADIDDEDSSYQLLIKNEYRTYVAESDLVGPNGTHTKSGRVLFNSPQTAYRLAEGKDVLNVDLVHQQDGVDIIKRFTFKKDSYQIGVEYIVDNNSQSPWKAAMYGRIRRDDFKPKAGGMFQLQPYLGAATTTVDDKFKKYDFEDLDESQVQFDLEGGWVSMVQHYFVSAWVPDANTLNKYRLHRSSNRQFYLLGYTTPLFSIAPGEQQTIAATFYAGPKIIDRLEPLAPGLDLTVDFGVLWFIAKPLFHLLDFIHNVVGNWGLSIILLTFFIKLVFFYPSAISYRSMAKMRKLMPQMQEMKERYSDDRQRMGVETMKLYKKEGVNPLGGCLPMLMQMPVFMALYWMIMESVELRHSPFLFWISDLSVRDPLYILPVFMGAIMFVQQKLNPPPQDPMQAKIFQFMPIGFTFILMFLPAALTLYMAVNTTLSFIQQYLITKQIEKAA